MVEQGSELHLLIFPCCFPHAGQPLGHALPALRRVRVRLTSVLFRCVTPRRRTRGPVAQAFARRPASWLSRRYLRGLPVPDEVEGAGQGRTCLSGDEADVWIRESALP